MGPLRIHNFTIDQRRNVCAASFGLQQYVLKKRVEVSVCELSPDMFTLSEPKQFARCDTVFVNKVILSSCYMKFRYERDHNPQRQLQAGVKGLDT